MAKFYSVSPSNAQKVDNSNNSTNFPRFGQIVLTSSSNLIGHAIGQVDVWVSRSSSSVSGTAYCRIRKGTDDSIAYEVGSLDVSTIIQSGNFPSNPTTFGNASTSTNTYALVANDKVLIEFSGGDSSNYLRCGDTGSGNTPYESGTNSRSVEYWTAQGYYLHNNPRDFAANFWDATGGGAPPAPPPPTPPPPAPPPPPPTVGYVTNTAKDIAGVMFTVATGTTPPPPPPPPGVPPGPPPTGLTKIYSVTNGSNHIGEFLNGIGNAGSAPAFIRVGEKASSRSSQLVGMLVKQVDFVLQKVGNPTGSLTVTIRKAIDETIGCTFGVIDVSTIPTTFTTYEFVNLSNTYKIAPYDKICVEYSGGDSNNYIAIDEDQSDSYDGQHTSSAYFTVAHVWNTTTSKDICGNLWV